MTNIHQPIACSLTTKDAAHQFLEWTDLQGHALTAERIDGGAVMTFDAELADSVEDLAARERSCCGFLSITTLRSDNEVRLEITADNPDAHALIEAMTGVGEQRSSETHSTQEVSLVTNTEKTSILKPPGVTIEYERGEQVETKSVRRIGSWGTASRLILGGLFIYWALGYSVGYWAFGDGVGWDDAILGLVVFPAAVSLVLALRRADARPLRLVGPGGHALNILIWVVAWNLAPVPTLVFGGVTQILAATRGYAGCELFAISNWLRQRDDQIGCPVHSLVDALEAQAKGRQLEEAC
jgi:hypothetical protein